MWRRQFPGQLVISWEALTGSFGAKLLVLRGCWQWPVWPKPDTVSMKAELLYLVVSCAAGPAAHVGARLKCHRVCKVEMTPGHRGGLTRPPLLSAAFAMDAPLSAY